MQKNWRKMISIRHRRLTSEMAAEKKAEESKIEEKQPQLAKDAEEQEDAVDAAKKQLQRLEHKLQGLTDQKHAKFQLLKDMLVEEARSKMTGGGAAAPATVAKKRRVEFKDPNMTPNPAKMQSPAPSTEAPSPAAMSGYNPPGSTEKA